MFKKYFCLMQRNMLLSHVKKHNMALLPKERSIMLCKTIALERDQGTQSSEAAEKFNFSSKPRIPRERKDISPLFPSVCFLEGDVRLLPLLLKDSCFQLYTMLPGT